ncbi:hypothetical protein J6590_090773, partial [Homalodisca vitripennis]
MCEVATIVKFSLLLYTLKAVDLGMPQLCTLTTLQVTVLDVNDNPPEFLSRSYAITVPENVSVSSEIVKVDAISKDTGVNAQIIYTIVEGNEQGKFDLHPITEITCRTSFMTMVCDRSDLSGTADRLRADQVVPADCSGHGPRVTPLSSHRCKLLDYHNPSCTFCMTMLCDRSDLSGTADRLRADQVVPVDCSGHGPRVTPLSSHRCKLLDYHNPSCTFCMTMLCDRSDLSGTADRLRADQVVPVDCSGHGPR